MPVMSARVRPVTVAGLLRLRAAESAEREAYLFLADGEAEGERLTWGELDRRARAIACTLQESLRPGDRALLLYPPGLDFVAAFFGCLYAGVVAVPAYPPRPNDRSLDRLRSVAHDAEPRAALTTAGILAAVSADGRRDLAGSAPELAAARWIATDALGETAGALAEDFPEDPEAIAFLQYTSGSTSTPKGVMVTHANLMHNEAAIGEAFRQSAESVVVGWLPLYHDMGLIGNVLQPLHAGSRCVLMAPAAFLQRPRRWLEAISRYGGTTSGGPSFSYELCVRRIPPEQREGLDLRSWRLAFNGAEPVRAETMERFAEAFAPCGFDAAAFYPCYGLAEATLFVSGGPAGTEPRTEAVTGGRPLVSCGHAWGGQRIVIADPETGAEMPPGAEGEIWVAGPSVAAGYWRNPEATERDFQARLMSRETGSDETFLRTGDLGVMLGSETAGDLYVTGRIKDLIILRGRNLYPQDLERTAEGAHPELRPGGAAAFAVSDESGEERLVIVAEVERRRREDLAVIADAVRRAIAEEHEAQAGEVVLVRVGGVPKTSSGKVRRSATRAALLAGELPVLARSGMEPAVSEELAEAGIDAAGLAALPAAERGDSIVAIERFLRSRAAAALGIAAAAIDPERPLTAYGLDSLAALELKGSVEAALGLSLPLGEVLEGAGTAKLAEALTPLPPLPSPPLPPGEGETNQAEDETDWVEEFPPLPAVGGAMGEGGQGGEVSFGERALWFLDRLAPDAGAYNIAVAARVHGDLDPDALRRAFAALTDRHEALRTVFPLRGEVPVRRVLQVGSAAVDFRVMSDAGEALAAEAWRPFDLAAGPLVRVRVVDVEGGEKVLLLCIHHMVADFWSLAVMARDLGRLVRGQTLAEGGGRPASEFVRWQAEMLAGPRGEALGEAWRQALAGVPDLDLPTDRPRPPVQTWRGSSRTAVLPAGEAVAARSLASGQGATLFAALLAVFQAQLGRYAGQDDFAVGTPTAGRGSPGWEETVGYLVNPVALRADLAGDPAGNPTFGELLAKARTTAVAALESADFPFALLAERLRPVRDPARPPLFQVMFALHSQRPGDPHGLAAFALGVDGARLAVAGLDLESVRLEERRSQFEMSLSAAELPDGGIGLSIEVNADLFDGATAERMLGHFRTLLAGAAADPAAPLSALPLLTAAEQAQLAAWNETPSAPGMEIGLHGLVAAQAARTPDAEAVVGEDERITYAELMARASRLALTLRKAGIGPEVRVGLCLRRTPDLLAAILGILSTGGAYVPLDPAYPQERLDFMLADSGARLLVTEKALADRFELFEGTTVLAEEGAASQHKSRLGEGPKARASLAQGNALGSLAYIIYTSGSTGRPKGVGIEHRSAVALVRWALGVFSPDELRGVLAATSVCFDLSIFEIFVPLAAGGRVILAPGILELPRLAARDEVTLINAVPSPMAELVNGPLPAGLRTVNLAGEALKPELVDAIYAHPQVERVVNLYGPSEDTTYSTWTTVPRSADVTIGRPVAGTRAWVLGRRGEALPVGVPGELCLGGEGLARGYLGRPELTAERFVPDPFGGRGERLYRTGDRARLRSDGEIEFLGRLDGQVKIRGFRVELGEIEATLERCPAVAQAAVSLRTDGPAGEPRLVGHLVAAGETGGAALQSDAEAFLRARLPAAFIPAAWVILEALPRSPNGKVDRRALPAPLAAEHGEGAAPRTPTEEILAGLFAELLGRERVGIHDDFFALGGHSLLATRAVSRIARLFGADLPVSALFQAPTVAALAERLMQSLAGASASLQIRLLPRDAGTPLPLSFAQQRLWFLDRLEPGTPVYNMPGAVDVRGPLSVPALAAALSAIVARHETLRTVYAIEQGAPVQRIAPPGAQALQVSVVDLSALPAVLRDAEAERQGRREARAPFDLARGPVVRAVLLRLAAAEHRLLVTLHHIAADGWSLGLFLDELAAVLDGRPVPALAVQYADWAAWQRAWMDGGELDAQLAWWRERLAGLPVLELPADRPRPAVRDPRGGSRSLPLPAELETAVARLARQAGCTAFMVLLGAFQALLARITGEDVIPVGSPVANRRRVEVEPLIGLFVNTLVLTARAGDDPGFEGMLARVREACLGAYAHQDVPFERLVQELQPERDLGQNPLFQVMFVLDEPLPPRRAGALALTPRRAEAGTSRFDLLLAVTPGEEGGRGGWTLATEHAAALFESSTIDRLLHHFANLLAGAVATPGARLSALPLLTAAEQAQLAAWNATAPVTSTGLRLHDLVAAQAARTPDAEAVVGEDERITYAELMARAGRVARTLLDLRGIGIGPEVRVGLCLRRTPDLLAAILGILSTGGTYVPLDPAYPQERLDFMLADSGAKVLWTEKAFADRFGFFEGITLQAEEAAASQHKSRLGGGPKARAALAQGNALGSLAYIIYTSGSTGRPKGVGIEHRSAVALVQWALGVFSPDELRGVLAATSVCFDLSIFEIFVPLASGGRVILAPGILDLPRLAASAEVTLINTVPSPMAELVRGALPAGLRTVNLAGEALKPELVERIYAHPQVERVVNLYGPSEDTTYSTWTVVPRGADVTIGRPVAGTRAWVLGRRGELLPVGAQGELCLGGAGLARGYLGRPELTAERFVPDPFNGKGERLYRTGDRVRLRSDGEIEFLGRFDQQVKLRGFRIELGEIEVALASCPGVAEAAVMLRTDGAAGEPRLVGYVVPAEAASGVAARAEAFLRERLPAAFIPSAWVVLDAFPRSPSGKVDRRALPAPPSPEAPERMESVAPRTPLEARLAAIWSEALGVERVGVHDSFFALGGHSLLAVRMAFRIAEDCGVDVPVSAIFAAPTVAEMAARLERGEAFTPSPEGNAGRPVRPVSEGAVPPRNPLEERLAGLWSEILGVQPIGVHDSFFALGGQSLLAARLAFRIAKVFGVDLPVPAILAAPTVAEMAVRLKQAAPAGRMETVRPDGAPEGTGAPLSFAQQRLWFIDLVAPGSGLYNLAVPLRFAGRLDVPRLERALAEVVRRHEPLRTVYCSDGVADGESGPVQIVLPHGAVPLLPRISLEGLPEPGRSAAARALLAEQAALPFDLRRGPVARFVLIEMGGEVSFLAATFHHIAADGWSLGIFSRELAALYSGSAPLPELPVRYADAARAERRAEASGAFAAQLAYWRGQLAGIPVLDLPGDRPRPAQPSPRGGSRRFDLPAGLATSLAAAGRGAGATPFMVLLAGFTALLSRLSGQDDFGIGVPVAGRSRAETAGLIGLFVNTLVLRTRLDADPIDPTFLELARRVRDTAVAAQANQDVPFEKVVEELQPERTAAVSPLFQVMFAFLSDPASALRMPGLDVSLVDLDTVDAKFDLTLSIHEWGGRFQGALEYRADLFEPATVDRMAGWLLRLLEGAAGDPSCRLWDLPLLTAAEERQLRAGTGPVEESLGGAVHHAFEDAARRSPGMPAVVSGPGGAEILTAAGLDDRANRLAHHLLALGLAVEERVAVCLEQSSPELLTALLAVLKAGGVYLPLDPAYPRERMQDLLEDAGAALLITVEALAGRLPLTEGLRAVLLDRDAAAIAAREAADPAVPVDPRSLAYIIYTSGSTGRPKGVGVPHGAAAAHCAAIRRAYGVAAGDRVMQLAAIGFDVSVEQLLSYIPGGATLVLRGEALPGTHEFTASIGELGLTIADLPTAFWSRWVADFAAEESAGPPASLRPLRKMVVGGEELLAEPVRVWSRSPLAAVPLLNGYGPTETVITATLHAVQPEDGAGPVSIGRPLPGRSAWVVDRAGNLVPAGVPGELWLGGPLARGYLGRPATTAESFVPDPFSGRPGARLYRTGDRVRSRADRADSDLEFLGRIDGQVKVRGFRIEPGEVEAALTSHPAVREAAVAAVERAGGDKILAAWVVPAAPDASAAGLPAVLRDSLRERLPAYMVPTAWSVLPVLPLNANGKIDRKALPPPALPALPAMAERDGAAPPAGTPEQELLSGLFADLLAVETVGPDDDFFALGGHSLLATQLVSRLRAVLGVSLPLADLFDAPTPAGLARKLEAVRRAGGELPPRPPLTHMPAGEAPLSFSQQRMWFLHQLEPDSAAYHVPGALRLRGPLRPDVLARALAEIVRRHEALRTVFAEHPDGPVQVVLPPAPGDRLLPVVDLGALPGEVAADESLRLLAREADRPFDLVRGPLLRTQLLRLGAEEHLLAVVMHHINSDAWSLGLVLRELTALYNAFSCGDASPLPELEIQYADFARWQRGWLTGAVLDRELAHWREVLSGASEVQELPFDRPRTAVSTHGGHRGGRRPFALSAERLAAVRALGRREGWTLFMTLLAAFQALLTRLSGQEDAVVGSPIANRNLLETERLIGFFTNTLALRLGLGSDPAFREIGRRVRAVALDAYAHEDLPFEKLVEEMAPERQPGLNPLFQVMLVVQRSPIDAFALPGVTAELMDVETGMAKFDLTFFLFDAVGEGMTGTMEYSRDLFDAATIDRLLASFDTLLAAAVESPALYLSDLPLLGAAERAELMAWTRPLVPFPEPRLVHELVEAQAMRHPDAEAVVCGGVRLTYGELMAQARHLARHLAGLGVGPDVPVGIFQERSPAMLVSLLAVLEAGGAYLPLDPSYPRERLHLMLEEAGAPVVLTDRASAAAVPGGVGAVVVVDAEAGWVEGPKARASSAQGNALGWEGPRAAPENLAYLVYTSGSTGRPKGVAMTHAAITAMLAWQLRTSAAGSGRTLQFASLSFDVSFQEIFSAWSAGGAVVLVSEDVRRDPPALLALLAEERVERLFLPFVALQQLAVAASAGPLPAALREVMSAGEQLYVTPQVAGMLGRLPGAVLYNHYGPSETHAATWLALTGDPAGWPERPTIGVPLDHARIFLLDRWQQLAPSGVPGEIWIGGGGLARGYQARPDLTAERFLPDPFSAAEGWQPGDRLYRTGDLARRLPDGTLEYLGRGDAQVKVRGQRIEPAEVETALARHPAVLQAAVAVRGDSAGARRLVAYLVFREGVPVPAFAEIKAFLAEVLPDPMIPSAWAHLDALPLTPSGKLDRRALARIAPEESHQAFEPPSGPAEEILAGIWRDVLGVERVGRHDDFFDLGGHSLLATQVASRLRAAFRVELPLRRLFEGPTLAEMAAAALVAVEEARGESPAPPITRAPRESHELPLSFAQERLWFLDRLQPGPAYDIPLALRATGRLDVQALAAALGEIVRRHEVLRTVFADRDGTPVQVVRPAAGQALAVVDLTGVRGDTDEHGRAQTNTDSAERPCSSVSVRVRPCVRVLREATRLAAAEASWTFDLTSGPLLRTVLIALAPDEHLLLVNLHHIAADGWSLGVLVRELKALYAAALHGEPSPLPELPVQYSDFARWQRGWLAGEVLERQLAWWRERLAGAPAALEIPADRPRPPVQSGRGAEHRFSLGGGLAQRLAALGREEGATLFMVLASGVFTLLARRTGQSDLVVGSPIANRNHIETEGLIGFFVNNLALRADLSRAAAFRDLLRQVREASLGAYAHQDLPFEKLVEELHPDRDLSRSPLFQVSVALQNAPLPAAELDGLALVPAELPATVAKLDLSFVFAGSSGDRLEATIEYATDLFDAATVARLAGHLAALLDAAAAEPAARLAELPLLGTAEHHQVVAEWNDTAEPVEGGALLHQLFEAQAALRPGDLAVTGGEGSLTYGELDAAAERLAHLLRGLGGGLGDAAGIWMERSPDMVTAVLAVLKAGGTYIPLDPSWPAERAETILGATGARVVLTRTGLLPAVQEIQWRLPRLTDVVCLDVQDAVPPPEPLDPESVRALWDYVAESADPEDVVTAGGFVNSFTGQPFSLAEVEEYRDRVLALAAPWLKPEARVLEIGCGAGLILWEMARRAAFCAGLDPSPRTQERNREHARAAGITNVELAVGFAHEAAAVFGGREAPFDLIVLASTVQFFPGPLYLERVIEQALGLLAPGGAVLIADVPDARRQGELSLALAAAGAPPKTGAARVLWLDEDLFRDVSPEAAVLHRREGFANELGFRYDVVVRKDDKDSKDGKDRNGGRRKRLWTGWHVARQSAERLAVAGFPESVAYVIHTSGSTGTPKGIAVQHAPAVELVRWVDRTFSVGPGDRLLFVTSLAFDLSVWDIFGVLGAGGALHIASETDLRDPQRLARLLVEEPVTIWDSAPAALQQLAPLFPETAATAASLRLVLLSGDWIPVPLPDRVRAAFPGARVVSLGGATEATVWSNWYPIDPVVGVDPRWPSIPYGRPIANARYHVLDGALQPCPIGVPGDLWIGGRCLSVGYTGQPALTAERFIPDPFGEGRLYRTGDQARHGRDGNLEFLGRRDQQVKVRGFRIELGEIEVALARHPAVREAVAVVHREMRGESADGRLVAYIVPVAGAAPPAAELRAFLQRTLPEYMVPWTFVTLDAMPVTANGKLDRAALPAPLPAAAAAAVAPRNALEREIAAAWREVLELDAGAPLGVEDNFFDVGGSSLLVGRLQARLRRSLGREVSFVDLFSHPTIDSLARSLAEAPAAGALEEEARARTDTRRERLRQVQKQRRGGRRTTEGASNE